MAYYRDIPADRFPGTNNAVYGNRIVENAGLAIAFPYELQDGDAVSMGPEDQRVICGNEVTGETQAEPKAACPSEVPGGDGIGHTGGNSPW